MLRGWLHDIDPEQTLEFSKEFWRFRNRGEGNEEYLKNLIKDYLIDNNHRTTLVVTPNPEHQEGIEKKIIDKLAPLIKDEKKRQEINKTFKQLETFQNEQDSEDDLKKLPSLSISDLPQKPPVIHLEDMEITESIPLYYCDTYTGGIVYIDFAFDITGLDRDLLPYLTFFESALCGVGLPGLGYNKIARRLALLTGGFWGSANINTIVRRNECKIFLIFRTKMLEIKIKEALNLIFDLFLHADFTDTQRLKDIFFELKNSFRSSLIPSGSFYAALRAGSFSSYPLFLEEQIRGITQILFLSKMAGNNNVHKYDKKLQDMKNTIIAKNRLIVNMTCERKNFNKNKECIENKVSSLPVRKLLTDSHQSGFIKGKKKIESLAVTTSINFNAKVLSTSPYGTKENALLSVISHLLNTGYLWEKVRMQGGAYGASISFYGTDGTLVFSSYRDPNILSTLKAFREAVVLIRDNKIKKDQIEKAIIGTVAKSEKPFTPGKRGYLGFKRKLYGITDEMRQKNRDIILSADSETLSEVANKLLENWDETSQVVISNKSSILKESKCMKELKDSMQILPL